MVARVQLHDMYQDEEEPIRAFAARLKGQADVCKFTVECPSCSTQVNYTNQVLRDVLTKGISDLEIRLGLLSAENQEMSLEDTVQYVEAKESGKRSATKLSQNCQAASSKRSQYQKSKRIDQKIKCAYCGKTGHGRNSPLKARKNKCPAYGKTCTFCGIPNHTMELCRLRLQGSKATKNGKSAHIDNASDDDDAINECPIWQELCSVDNKYSPDVMVHAVDHHMYSHTANRWVKKKSKPQPFIKLTASINQDDYSELGLQLKARPKLIKVMAMADTGCQSCLAGYGFARRLGLNNNTLLQTKLTMYAANKSPINVLGAIFVRFSGKDNSGKTFQTRQMVYITNSSNNVYLSREACVELGLVNRFFPTIGSAGEERSLNDPGETIHRIEHRKAGCECPARSLPPKRPQSLPFKINSNGDIEKLKGWLLNYYSASSFNTCTHQPLPKMHGPPLRLMIDPDALTHHVPCHTPMVVPLYWMEEVKAGLDQDVRLGVIQPVPIGQPVTWCHRMVVCAKRDGKPRRTVDMQSLNKSACRETHHTQSPYLQARSVPSGKLKTVFDCWNGYHSIALHKDDYQYTTFITPWGRYQYKVAPQGYIASGDGYCRRFDEIVSSIPNKTKCIDDTLLWSDNVEESFKQAVNWLDTCGKNGIILNRDKFVFAQHSVEFAGFRITDDSIKPCEKHLSAIKDFPTPSSLTDIRSWFGLVNQVAYAFAQAEVMEPFRRLLKSNVTFNWDNRLEQNFKNLNL